MKLKNDMLFNTTPSLSVQKSQDSSPDNSKEKNKKQKHYFLKFAITLALSYWLLESAIHYFWYGESEFEIIPSDVNELWMRCSILVLLATSGLFADYKSRKVIKKNLLNLKSKKIAIAKKQWEIAIDSLPQVVIAMDIKARITRVNRTVETWGIAKVDEVNGLYVSDFLKCFNNNYTDDAWTSDWPYIWQRAKDKGVVERKIEKKNAGKTYLYSLRTVTDHDIDDDDIHQDKCYAVLVIDDITARQDVEESLKSHARVLEEIVDVRTLELKIANEQLRHKLHAQKQAKKELKESQESRLCLLRELFSTQEKERKRIACELHDSIGQSLGATKFKVEELIMNKQNFTNDDEYNQFNGLVETIKNAIQEVRHIAMDLRPAMLDDLGVLPTLKWFSREFSNTYAGITVEQSLNVKESYISEEKKVVIFRIVQESMNNIAKHAKATKIVLELSHNDTGLKMCITDNGLGFDMNALHNDSNLPKCSFGLSSMRERAESTNGTFEIESITGNGTTVMVTWND